MCLGRIAPTRIDYLTQTKRYSKKTSLKQALTIEEAYDNHRMIGLIYCATILKLLNTKIKGMIELFEGHDQIFILKGNEVYKLHL
jgi:hypothetical protein